MVTKEYTETYTRIPASEYQDALEEFSNAVRSVLEVSHSGYGQQVFIEPDTNEICYLAEQFGMKIRGKKLTITPSSIYLKE